MANLSETPDWEAGVYQIETTDPVIGGAPNPATGAGMSNIPHLQLAKRTSWLKAQVDDLVADLAGLGIADVSGLQAALNLKANIASPTFTGNPSGPTPAQFDNDTSFATTEFVQRALGNVRSAETVSGSFTILPADAGKVYVCGLSSAITITLPSIAATALGAVFTFINTGTANVTLQRAGSDTIDNGPDAVTSMVVPPNMSLQIVRSQGTSLWHVVGLTAQSLASAFSSSIGNSGWQRLPSGLIVQWGRGTPTGGDLAVTFPIAFPTQALSVFANHQGTEGCIILILDTPGYSTTGVTLRQRTLANTANNNLIRWTAIGY